MNIVAIGGGTGLSVMLRGLKQVTSNITAVVTVSDDGGGSGVLREDLGMLPPGDIRSCILALSTKEDILQELFRYRFKEGQLNGQSFGNLMIAAMVGISDSFEDAVKKISDIFAITGEVLPVSDDDLRLYAKLADGTVVAGESNIPVQALLKSSPIEKIWLEPAGATTSPLVQSRIREADLIVIGPGSLFTSIIPNLLIDPVVTAVNASSAKVIYISNIMTQSGETDDFTVGDHVRHLLAHTKLKTIDVVFANNHSLPEDILLKYQKEQAMQSFASEEDRNFFKMKGIQLVEADYVNLKNGYVRHHSAQLAEEMVTFVEKIYRSSNS